MCICGVQQPHLRFMPRSRVTLVPEQGAAGVAEQVFAEARQALAVPFVPELLRAYAAIPNFLEVMWPAVTPALQTADFIRCAGRLRAQAFTEAFNYLGGVDALAPENDDINEVLRLFHDAAPRILLLTSVVLRALEAPVGSAKPTEDASLPAPANVTLADSSGWNAVTREIIDEYKTTRGTGIVNCFIQALANHPAFLREYWKVAEPLIASPLHARLALELRETSFAFCDDLPVVVDLTPERLADADITAAQLGEVGRITNLFATEYAAMLLDIEIARIATERAERVRPTISVQAA